MCSQEERCSICSYQCVAAVNQWLESASEKARSVRVKEVLERVAIKRNRPPLGGVLRTFRLVDMS